MILENTAPQTISGEEYLLQLEIGRLNSRIHELEQCWEFSAQDGVRLTQSLEASNAEIARLKTEIENVRLGADLLKVADIIGEREVKRLQSDSDLLKAALRWLATCPAIAISLGEPKFFYGNSKSADIPPEFGAVIAEAVESKT